MLRLLRELQDSQYKKVLEERIRLEEVYELEKVKSNSLQKEVADFREDLLKVKSERHTINNTLNIKHEECKGFKGNIQFIEYKYKESDA